MICWKLIGNVYFLDISFIQSFVILRKLHKITHIELRFININLYFYIYYIFIELQHSFILLVLDLSKTSSHLHTIFLSGKKIQIIRLIKIVIIPFDINKNGTSRGISHKNSKNVHFFFPALTIRNISQRTILWKIAIFFPIISHLCKYI